MSFKLDASKFKKIGGDKDHTVLRHEAGHQLKIAHAGLSPKIRGQIAEIPHFESGGYLEDADRLKVAPKKNTSSEPSQAPAAQPSRAPASAEPEYQGKGHTYTGHEDEDMMAGGGNVKSKAHRNNELKGINVGTVASDGKQSHAGAILEKTGDSTIPKMKAKQVLSEMKSMPKPKLMAEGGRCERCPCPSCSPQKMADGGIPLPQTSEEMTRAEDHGQPLSSDWESSSGQLPVAIQPPISPMSDPRGTNLDENGQGAETVGRAPSAMDPTSPAPDDSAVPAAQPPPLGESYAEAQGSLPAPSTNLPEYDQQTQQAEQAHNTPEAVRSHLDNEALNYEHDLSNGHITPKTYGDLFADRGTLGKIGMIFGMLLSGAGSGLSGQPNVLLHMLDKQIDNDMEAQKQSKANAHNFLNLNQAHQKQLADIKYQQQQGKLTEAQAAQMRINSAILARTQAHNQAVQSGFQSLIDRRDAMPDGPLKDQATNTLGMMYPLVKDSIVQRNTQAAALAAYGQMMSGSPVGQGDGGGAPVDYNKMNQLQRHSQMGIPGAPSGEDLGNMTKEAAAVEENRATKKTFDDSYNKLNNMFLAGKLSPNMRAAEVNTLSAQLARQTAHRYNAAEAHAQAEGMFPAANDWKSTRREKEFKNDQFFEAEEANTPTLNRFGLKSKMPAYKSSPTKAGANPGQQSQAPVSPGRTATNPKTGKTLTWDGKNWK